jgi:hypothetical protein
VSATRTSLSASRAASGTSTWWERPRARAA